MFPRLEASSLHVGVSSDSRFQIKFGRVPECVCIRLLSLEAVPDRRINGKETYQGLSRECSGMSSQSPLGKSQDRPGRSPGEGAMEVTCSSPGRGAEVVLIGLASVTG